MSQDNEIVLILLPPNTSHLVQPLDKMFGAFKKRCETLTLDWYSLQYGAKGVEMGRYVMLRDVAFKAFEETFSDPEFIQNAWAKCGLFPFNPSAVDLSKLTPSKIYRAPSLIECPCGESHLWEPHDHAGDDELGGDRLREVVTPGPSAGISSSAAPMQPEASPSSASSSSATGDSTSPKPAHSTRRQSARLRRTGEGEAATEAADREVGVEAASAETELNSGDGTGDTRPMFLQPRSTSAPLTEMAASPSTASSAPTELSSTRTTSSATGGSTSTASPPGTSTASSTRVRQRVRQRVTQRPATGRSTTSARGTRKSGDGEGGVEGLELGDRDESEEEESETDTEEEGEQCLLDIKSILETNDRSRNLKNRRKKLKLIELTIAADDLNRYKQLYRYKKYDVDCVEYQAWLLHKKAAEPALER